MGLSKDKWNPDLSIPFVPDVFVSHYGFPDTWSKEQVIEKARQKIFAEILFHSPVNSPEVFGLKTTHLFGEVEMLKALFPEMLTVVMVRDPRDVIVSNVARTKSSDRHGGIILGLMAYERFHQRNEDNPDVIAMKYEDLIIDPEATIKSILELLELSYEEYDKNSFDTVGSNSSFNSSSGLDVVNGVGIRGDTVGRYKELLEADVIQAADVLFEQTLLRFGYEHAAESKKDLCTQENFVNLMGEIFAHSMDQDIDTGSLVSFLNERAHVSPLGDHLRIFAKCNKQDTELTWKNKRIVELEREVEDLRMRNLNLNNRLKAKD